MSNDDRPLGAIHEDERLRLNAKSIGSSYQWQGKAGYYAVTHVNAELMIGGRGHHKFSFDWPPTLAYYFTNYFHAWAYSLKLQEKLKCNRQ